MTQANTGIGLTPNPFDDRGTGRRAPVRLQGLPQVAPLPEPGAGAAGRQLTPGATPTRLPLAQGIAGAAEALSAGLARRQANEQRRQEFLALLEERRKERRSQQNQAVAQAQAASYGPVLNFLGQSVDRIGDLSERISTELPPDEAQRLLPQAQQLMDFYQTAGLDLGVEVADAYRRRLEGDEDAFENLGAPNEVFRGIKNPATVADPEAADEALTSHPVGLEAVASVATVNDLMFQLFDKFASLRATGQARQMLADAATSIEERTINREKSMTNLLISSQATADAPSVRDRAEEIALAGVRLAVNNDLSGMNFMDALNRLAAELDPHRTGGRATALGQILGVMGPALQEEIRNPASQATRGLDGTVATETFVREMVVPVLRQVARGERSSDMQVVLPSDGQVEDQVSLSFVLPEGLRNLTEQERKRVRRLANMLALGGEAMASSRSMRDTLSKMMSHLEFQKVMGALDEAAENAGGFENLTREDVRGVLTMATQDNVRVNRGVQMILGMTGPVEQARTMLERAQIPLPPAVLAPEEPIGGPEMGPPIPLDVRLGMGGVGR